jgi:hypothetical protein
VAGERPVLLRLHPLTDEVDVVVQPVLVLAALSEAASPQQRNGFIGVSGWQQQHDAGIRHRIANLSRPSLVFEVAVSRTERDDRSLGASQHHVRGVHPRRLPPAMCLDEAVRRSPLDELVDALFDLGVVGRRHLIEIDEGNLEMCGQRGAHRALSHRDRTDDHDAENPPDIMPHLPRHTPAIPSPHGSPCRRPGTHHRGGEPR